jgi:hypothetical protein
MYGTQQTVPIEFLLSILKTGKLLQLYTNSTLLSLNYITQSHPNDGELNKPNIRLHFDDDDDVLH